MTKEINNYDGDLPFNPEVEVDEFHYHEMMDRLHNANEVLDVLFEGHPVLGKHHEIKELINQAQENLFVAYQRLGNITD